MENVIGDKMKQDRFKISNIEKYRDNLKYDAFYYAKLVGISIVYLSAFELAETRIYDGKLKTLALAITAFTGVSIFNITLIKSIKSYLNYLKLNKAIMNKEYSKEVIDMLIKHHLEDKDEIEREKNLC